MCSSESTTKVTVQYRYCRGERDRERTAVKLSAAIFILVREGESEGVHLYITPSSLKAVLAIPLGQCSEHCLQYFRLTGGAVLKTPTTTTTDEVIIRNQYHIDAFTQAYVALVGVINHLIVVVVVDGDVGGCLLDL